MAAPVSDVVHTFVSADSVGADTANLIAQSKTLPGNIVTVIAPSDTMRGESTSAVDSIKPTSPPSLEDNLVSQAIRSLESSPATTAVIVNGRGLRREGLEIASRIAQKTGCTFFSPCFPGRLDRGAGLPSITRLPYFPEAVQERLAPFDTLILIGAYTHPVSFFKYDGIPSDLVPERCTVINLAQREHDTVYALRVIEEGVNASSLAPQQAKLTLPDAPSGAIDRKSIAAAIAHTLPEHAIISDTAGMSGAPIFYLTQTAHAHTSMYLTGGGIGMGIPCASGAAVACPERPVLSLQSDGAGLYTLQALWTQARESLNVTTVIFANRKYQILQTELTRAGIEHPGPIAQSLTDLSDPDINWCDLARGFGVPASRPDNIEAFQQILAQSFREPGPRLIELLI